jgi:zinc finger protein
LKEKKYEMAIDCPACKNKTTLMEMIKELPSYGKILISSLACTHCGFKFNDVMNAEFHSPSKWIAEIESEKDLNTKIIKSSNASIKLQELGLMVSPGPLSQGYYSNLEGVLQRFKEAVEIAERNSEGKEKENAKKTLEEIEKTLNGKKKATLVLLDPFGNSKLIGEKVRQEKLSEKEKKDLTENVQIIEVKKNKK